jgi:lysophospholipase L1-like esterase
LKGDGEESKKVTVEKTGASEIVHTYGWYLRRYVADTKAAGATAIVLSPIPRNIWKEGKITRASSGYGKWAAEAAKDSGALFVDLNELIARRYEEMGQPRVASELFTAKDHTHTTRAGAQLNADCVAVGLRELTNSPFKPLLRSQ